jgi:SAM-dependent methyltransferase
MAAYHNDNWTECYDLWVRELFGDGPTEYIPMFKSVLDDIIQHVARISESELRYSPITIVDVGTGSGRVPAALLEWLIKKGKRREFDIVGVEPSLEMLKRAERFWNEAKSSVQESAEASTVRGHWAQLGAEDFAEFVKETGQNGEADLTIFAAGGICHVIKDEAMLRFLQNVKNVLSSHGMTVISVLKDFTIPRTGSRREVDQAKLLLNSSGPNQLGLLTSRAQLPKELGRIVFRALTDRERSTSSIPRWNPGMRTGASRPTLSGWMSSTKMSRLSVSTH